MNQSTDKPVDHDRVAELIELAGVYFMDGAFRTAAQRLRQAADHCDAIAAEMDAFIAGQPA